MKQILFFTFIVLVFARCGDDAEVYDTDLGYQYFPSEIGRFVIYKADSIFHDQPVQGVPGIHDTISYYIKEVLDSEFLDAQEEQSIRITRFKKDSLHQEWSLVDVWFSRRNVRNAEKVEENRRFIKLGFPISKFARWDGNALNDLDEWEYVYDSLGLDRTYGELSFFNTITVFQRNYLTEVNDEFAYEVYAPEVGLIYRKHKELYTRPSYLNYPIAENIIRGNEYNWEVIEYGVEE